MELSMPIRNIVRPLHPDPVSAFSSPFRKTHCSSALLPPMHSLTHCPFLCVMNLLFLSPSSTSSFLLRPPLAPPSLFFFLFYVHHLHHLPFPLANLSSPSTSSSLPPHPLLRVHLSFSSSSSLPFQLDVVPSFLPPDPSRVCSFVLFGPQNPPEPGLRIRTNAGSPSLPPSVPFDRSLATASPTRLINLFSCVVPIKINQSYQANQ